MTRRKTLLLLLLMVGVVLVCALFNQVHRGFYLADYCALTAGEQPADDQCVEVCQQSATHSRCTQDLPTTTSPQSTCSDLATLRGPGQKVVSFGFYGTIDHKRNYFKRIEANAERMDTFYPGWTMRVYHDVSRSNENVSLVLCQLQCRFSFLDVCYVGDLPGNQTLIGTEQRIWRFLPMADPLVDVFLSRDLDSRLSQRELDAVQEWLKSGLTFHVMRDHQFHGVAALAGMWGSRVHSERGLNTELITKVLAKGRDVQKKSQDQKILATLVWPNIKGKVMQHDSFYCKTFAGHGHMMPWPSRRLANQTLNFVGSRDGVDKVYKKECPAACRPAAHADWAIC